jgi:hypothetical protein
MGEPLCLYRYFAVRGESGEYLGVLEVTQDIAPIQASQAKKGWYRRHEADKGTQNMHPCTQVCQEIDRRKHDMPNRILKKHRSGNAAGARLAIDAQPGQFVSTHARAKQGREHHAVRV